MRMNEAIDIEKRLTKRNKWLEDIYEGDQNDKQ